MSRPDPFIPSSTCSAHRLPPCLRSPMRNMGALKYSLMTLISSTSLWGDLNAGPSLLKNLLKALQLPPQVMQLYEQPLQVSTAVNG